MFETKHVPCYIERLAHKKLKLGTDEIKASYLILRIDPFTPSLAAELEDAVKGVIYRRNDAQPNPIVESVTFKHSPKPQRIEFRADPKITPSLVLTEAKVDAFRCRIPKDGTQWVLIFRVTFAEITGQDLLYLKEALFEQRFLSFENATPGLFDAEEDTERRPTRRAAAAAASTATH